MALSSRLVFLNSSHHHAGGTSMFGLVKADPGQAARATAAIEVVVGAGSGLAAAAPQRRPPVPFASLI